MSTQTRNKHAGFSTSCRGVKSDDILAHLKLLDVCDGILSVGALKLQRRFPMDSIWAPVPPTEAHLGVRGLPLVVLPQVYAPPCPAALPHPLVGADLIVVPLDVLVETRVSQGEEGLGGGE